MEDTNKKCTMKCHKKKCIVIIVVVLLLIFIAVVVKHNKHGYKRDHREGKYAHKADRYMHADRGMKMDRRGMRRGGYMRGNRGMEMNKLDMRRGGDMRRGNRSGMQDMKERGRAGMMMHKDAGPDHKAAREAMMLTKWAVRLYDVVGHNEAIELLGSDAAVFDEQYVFVIDARDGTVLANPFAQDLVGTDVRTRSDATGKPYGKMIADASPRGEWISYLFRTPPDNREQQKYSFVVNYNGLIFGSGYYTE